MDWADHGKAVYFVAGVKGETHMFQMDAATGAVTRLTSGARNDHGFALHGSEDGLCSRTILSISTILYRPRWRKHAARSLI